MLKKGSGASIRKRGNNYEVQIAQQFRDMGWAGCVTSRAESRNTDAKKIDLCYSDPINVQCKCKNNYGNPLPVLEEMPKDNNYNIVITKVVNKGEFVSIAKDDFFALIKMLKLEGII